MVSYWIDLGLMEYREAHRLQIECVERRRTGACGHDLFLITEHPSVFTLGRRGGMASLTVDERVVRDEGVDIVQTERGGDITYHGPGQMVVYPIMDLWEAGISVTEFVHKLEEVMIRTAGDSGVLAERDPRNRGVWIGNNKIGSIGIRVRNGVTFHGLALNVNPSLLPFSWIKPCGLSGVGVTSLEKEKEEEITLPLIKWSLYNHLCSVFDVDLVKTDITMVLKSYHATRN